MSGARKAIDRSITDDNFCHCVRLMGAMITWAHAVQVGDTIDYDGLNMIAHPAEVAMAFIKDRADEETPLGQACRDALKLQADFAADDRSRSRKTRRNHPATSAASGSER